MPFLVQLFWAIVITYVTKELFSPEPPKMGNLDQKAQTTVDAPTINEGTAVPVVFGTVLTNRQNVSWYGGLNSTAFTTATTRGFKYRLTAQLSVCMGPIDRVREIRFDDLIVPAANITVTDTTNYIDYAIDAPDLLGGLDQEGGVQGVLRFYKGTTTQTYDIEMATLANSTLPAFRRVAYGVLRNFYIGTSPRLKAVSFLIERLPNSLGVTGNKHYIERTVSGHPDVTTSRDSNVVCAIYECIISGVWGARVGSAQLDTSSWIAAAETAWSEGLGFSTILITPQDIDSLVQGWLRYIDAQVFEDVTTGLLKIRLVREADLTDAPVFTIDEISDVKATRVSYSELRDTVKVTFTDANRNYETGGTMARNSAVTRALNGAVDLEVVELPGFSTVELAQRAAGQILRSSSYPLSKVEITGDRSMALLEPGQPFHLTWTRPNISAYFRVTKVNIREMSEGGVIVNAIEDIFAAALNTFTPPPSTGGSSGVDSLPRTIAQYLRMEAPYHLRRVNARSIIFGAVQPNLASIGFELNLAGYATDTTIFGWMATGRIAATVPQWSGSVLSSLAVALTLPDDVVSPDGAQYDAGAALLLVDGELMAYRTVTRNTDGTVTFGDLARGVLDTVPNPHTTASVAYVLPTARVLKALDLDADTTLHLTARTKSLTTLQPEASALSLDMPLASRALRPYPPGHLKINGTPWPSGTVSYPAVVTWVPRTRLASAIVLQDDAAATPETGTSYVVEVADPAGTIIEVQTTSGLTATLVSAGPIQVAVWALRDGLRSFQAQRASVTLPGLPPGRLTLAGLAPTKIIAPVSVTPAGALALAGRAPTKSISVPVAVAGTTILMSHFDATASDSSAYAHSFSVVGGLTIDTGIAKYGTGSLSMVTSGHIEYVQQGEEFALAGDFTLEAWVFHDEFAVDAGTAVLVSNWGSTFGWALLMDPSSTGTLSFIFSHESNPYVVAVSAASPTVRNEFYHIAVVRKSGVFKLFVNGVENDNSVGEGTEGYAIEVNGGAPLTVGGNSIPGLTLTYMHGGMDDLRITSRAEYWEDFTPPVMALPNGAGAAPGAGALALTGAAPSISAAGFRYWRLMIDEWATAGTPGTSGNTRVAELRYFTAASVEWPTSAMTGNSTPSPFVASASSVGFGSASECFNKLEDDAHRWISGTGGGAQWVTLDVGSMQDFTSMSLAPDGAASIGYYPTQIRVLGSNTGAFTGEETTVFSASGLTSGWTNSTPRTFSF